MNALPAVLINKINNYVDDLYLQEHKKYFDSRIKHLLIYNVSHYWNWCLFRERFQDRLKGRQGQFDEFLYDMEVLYDTHHSFL
jgi:hypothetical protein